MQITVNYQELAQGAHYLEQKSNDYQRTKQSDCAGQNRVG